jgi:hypothetical protein
MQAQNRLISVPTRQLALGAALVLAVALLGLVLFASRQHNAPASTTGAHVAVLSTASDNQAPDAKERNDIYSRALAQRFSNQSPDARERNEKLSGH